MAKPTLEAFCRKAKDLFMPEILRRSRNRDMAEDIFQDVLTVMITKWEQIDDPEHYFWRAIANNSQHKPDAKTQNTSSLDTSTTYIQLEAPAGSDPFFIQSYEQYNEYLNKAIASINEANHRVMLTEYLLGGLYDKKTKKYVAYTAEQFCKKYNIPERTFFSLVKEVSNTMRWFFDEDLTVKKRD